MQTDGGVGQTGGGGAQYSPTSQGGTHESAPKGGEPYCGAGAARARATSAMKSVLVDSFMVTGEKTSLGIFGVGREVSCRIS
jgi:hypothetical protein